MGWNPGRPSIYNRSQDIDSFRREVALMLEDEHKEGHREGYHQGYLEGARDGKRFKADAINVNKESRAFLDATRNDFIINVLMSIFQLFLSLGVAFFATSSHVLSMAGVESEEWASVIFIAAFLLTELASPITNRIVNNRVIKYVIQRTEEKSHGRAEQEQ